MVLRALRETAGYFFGFLLYWAGWCGMVPLGVLGRERLGGQFRLVRPTKTEVALLAIPPAIGFTVAFPSAVREADRRIVLTSAAIAGVNAAFEEVLWRGTYQAAFPEDSLLNTCYPTLGFAAWHYAPQAVFPNPRPGGAHSLVAVAGAMGLLWAQVARRQQSILWTTVSHGLFDFSGLGGGLYFGDRRELKAVLLRWGGD